jgi:DNA-directed RNA polymerase specialized sigma24 family protein
MLNLSIGAVKARLFRGRLRLREELSKVLKRG